MSKRRVLSVKSGNPITIQDEDIGITWPAALVGSIDIFVRQTDTDFHSRMGQRQTRGRPLS